MSLLGLHSKRLSQKKKKGRKRSLVLDNDVTSSKQHLNGSGQVGFLICEVGDSDSCLPGSLWVVNEIITNQKGPLFPHLWILLTSQIVLDIYVFPVSSTIKIGIAISVAMMKKMLFINIRGLDRLLLPCVSFL